MMKSYECIEIRQITRNRYLHRKYFLMGDLHIRNGYGLTLQVQSPWAWEKLCITTMEVIGPTNEGEKSMECPPNLKQISLKSHASNIPKRITFIEGASQQVLSQHNIMNATNLCNDYQQDAHLESEVTILFHISKSINSYFLQLFRAIFWRYFKENQTPWILW